MNKRILVVDADSTVLEAVSRYLCMHGWQVDCAADRDEAETLLARYTYSVVLTDVALAEEPFEGLNLLETVSHLNAPPKVIALSGHESAEVQVAARRRGADRFVSKPVSLRVLQRMVADLSSGDVPTRTETTSAVVFAQTELLKSITAAGGIRSFVQPIFQMADGKQTLAGVECLARGPAGSLYEPADVLFEYVRRKRAEPAVDCRCIEVALQSCSRISQACRVSVNVHATTLGRVAEFAKWLVSIAARYSVPVSQITVEIVEHGRALNNHSFLDNIASMRGAGIRIAMDDIGLGYSNYGILMELRPDYFKIDRYFVNGCHSDNYRRAMLASITQLARDFGSNVVAEGVDNPRDLEVLLCMGISLVQGYWFCRPLPCEDFARELFSPDGLAFRSLQQSDPASSKCTLGGLGMCREKPSTLSRPIESA